MTARDTDLATRVAALRWFHTISLPGDLVTDGAIDSSRVVPRLGLPGSLAGMSVLDIGAWDGFWSFECARRGAERVLATDSFSWGGGGWGTQEGFLLAREALGLESVVDDQAIDVMDLSPERVGGTFDVVLLLGVLYHLRDPITALERAASCCGGDLYVETEAALTWFPYPAARLYPGSELGADPTNWYQFNLPALRGLLTELGFDDIKVTYRTPLHRRVARATVGARRGQSFRTMLRSNRVMVRARRSENLVQDPL